MNIYEDGSNALDLERAKGELEATSLISNDAIKQYRVAEINAATLLDIAGSLRVLAAEAASAMGYDAGGEEYEDDDDGTRDFLVVGDRVTLTGHTDLEPGEVVSLGFDGDHALTADVRFANGVVTTYYVSSLVRVDDSLPVDDGPSLAEVREAAAGGAALIGVATPEETSALLSDEDEDGEEVIGGYELDVAPDVADLVDDIDADFEGESHPVAESAVDVLRANEAARKAAKKKGTKK